MSIFNIKDTILFQYSSSPIIKAIIEGVNDLIKPDEDINLFYNEMFNILSAQGVGLDFWGVKLGIGRNIKVKSTEGVGTKVEVIFYDGKSIYNL